MPATASGSPTVPPVFTTGRPAGAEDLEHATIALTKGQSSLLQGLDDLAPRQPCLVQYSGDHGGTRIPLAHGSMVLGRSPDCQIVLEGVGLSRRHAHLQHDGGAVVLRDLGSANGTFVNDRPVHPAATLRDGDVIRLGQVVLRFYERPNLDLALHDKLYRQATVDSLTGAHSKRYLLDAMEREIRLARRGGQALSVVALDLDHFKSVNDRFGHVAGDDVLRGVAQAIRGELRQGEVFGRMGGEEFVVLLPDTALPGARGLAERLRAAVSALGFELPLPSEQRRVPHRQTVSLGVAELAPAMATARDLLAAADERLYAAKRAGRNRIGG